MKLKTSCRLRFDIPAETPFILMLRPQSGAQQWVEQEEFNLSPPIQVRNYTDGFGNLCQRLIAPPGTFAIDAVADVHTADVVDQQPDAPFVKVHNLPDDVLHYLLPSRYCEIEHFTHLAWEIVGERQPGYDQVQAIADWIRESIHYDYNDSSQTVSARETLVSKTGVCRDLAHLGIALCRSLVIPARIVTGYLHRLTPMDMHAWFEAYVGDRWYIFDATQPTLRGGYVVVGMGRDAADVALYNQFGPSVYPTEQRVAVELIS